VFDSSSLQAPISPEEKWKKEPGTAELLERIDSGNNEELARRLYEIADLLAEVARTVREARPHKEAGMAGENNGHVEGNKRLAVSVKEAGL
jgi:hypothetical protein